MQCSKQLLIRFGQSLSGLGLALLLTGLLSQPLLAQVMIPAPPQLAATAWVLMDAHSGRVLASHNAEQRLPPASLTKMMTSYLVEYEMNRGNITPDERVPVSVKAWRMPGSRMFIQEGTLVSVEDLMQGIIVQSGNDASVAMAEYLAGSEEAFADLMNQHAQRLGMDNTQFRNSTGLPEEGHYSSAMDLAILAREKIINYPGHYSLYSQKEFTYNNIRQSNRNTLLWSDSSVDGLKTGHTDEAGYCLVASAVRNEMRLISVVLGTRSEASRAQESQKLLTYGFRYFETPKLYEKFQVLDREDVWQGEVDQVELGLRSDLYATIPRGEQGNLQARVEVEKTIKAPITAGQVMGQLVVTLGEEEVAREPLVALQNIEEAGFFKRIWHSLLLFVMGLFS
ncbi:D-alanyl-D-alanine carboxypeptidase family protein [Marinospirillum perlucidum]|uniref:D-alanyl-D-alanine carboxypeptidase family protein n=1 Tax=Marinospirillum perlucidum TaxID=1982602 RepID=UPI000DF37EA8|nr:D-alanyl-D-alanine carboxypeptidase family protein [Marinospirillum perlucidum]